MLFHIIGIKEVINGLENKKYNIDILIKWDSEEFIKSFLQKNNIIVLNITEYTKPMTDFGNLQAELIYTDKHEEKIEIVSYITDIKSALFLFVTIGFKIKYINFLQGDKLNDQQVIDAITQMTDKIESTIAQKKQEATNKKEQEKKMYKDKKLENTVKIAEQAFVQIEDLLQKVWNDIAQDKIRDISLMAQELTKLKMWRNDDKMLELLEKIYEKVDLINTEYLKYMQKNIFYPIENSAVTNVDIISENQKLKKAHKIKEIWAKRDSDDNYYLSFESVGIYAKFLFIDIKNKTKDIPDFIKRSFWYIATATLSMVIVMSFILWFKKISYSIDENLYHYVFLIKLSLFGLVLFFIQKVKKTTVYKNIMFLVLAIIITIILFWLIRVNFSF